MQRMAGLTGRNAAMVVHSQGRLRAVFGPLNACAQAERLGLLITADNLREVADEPSELAAASGRPHGAHNGKTPYEVLREKL